ncbi:MAG: TolC family protein [Gemmatimonadota bacterium]|nr:TolC family protein [Gemmatimonadota bacterium]
MFSHRHLRGNAIATLMLGFLFLAGCGRRPGPDSVEPTPPTLGRALVEAPPALADLGAERRPAARNPTGSLVLQDALALALLQSPGLAAYAWKTRAQEAKALQEGRRPNPSASFLVEDFGATGGLASSTGSPGLTRSQTTIQLGQLIELGGKRTARWQLANQDRILASWDYEIARIGVLTETTQRFVAVLAGQASLALADETARLVDSTLQSVASRVTAGVVSPMDQVRAELALADARLEAGRSRSALATSRQRLAASWGSLDAQFGEALGELRSVSGPPTLPGLEARLAGAPDLARWSAAVVQRQRSLALAKSRRIPDLSLTAGLRKFDQLDGQTYLLGVSLSLPLFDANGGAVQEAASRLAGMSEEQRAARIEAHLTLGRLHRELADAYAEVISLQDLVLPGARQAFEAVREGYRLGRFGYLDVLETQRTLIGAERRHLDVLVRYHQSVAELERLLGEPLVPATVPPALSGKE